MGGTLFERLHVPSPGNTRESGQDSNDFIGNNERSSTLGTPTMPSMNAPPGARRSRQEPWYRIEPRHGNPCDEDQGYEDRGYRPTPCTFPKTSGSTTPSRSTAIPTTGIYTEG